MEPIAEDRGSIPSCDHEIDKRAKQLLVTSTIAEHCTSSSTGTFHEIYIAINTLKDESKLTSKVLSGGYTNYSYKVYVDKHPQICVFAKLSFEFALWNPDKSSHYDLKRTNNEFKVMEDMSNIMPDCIVSPLACWDVEQEGQRMKLLVTEWSSSDEQFSNQFIDGYVDPRIALKLADTLAALHQIEDFDPEFNVSVKPCLENLLEQIRTFVHESCHNSDPQDRTETYLVEMGADSMKKIVDAMIANFHKRECLIHSDSHVFNILVETKPSITELELFGPEGLMVLCDWEMSMAGPRGRDIGLALAFPIGCNIAHSLNGHVVDSIDDYVISLLDCYCMKMVDAGKSPEEITAVYRNIVGWCGWFQFVVFYFGKNQLCFPVQNDDDKAYVRDATGILGLKLMRFSYDNDYIPTFTSLDQVKSMFEDLWQDEITKAFNKFAAVRRKSKHVMRPRKSSVYRATNRRVSDTLINFLSVDQLGRLSLSYEDG